MSRHPSILSTATTFTEGAAQKTKLFQTSDDEQFEVEETVYRNFGVLANAPPSTLAEDGQRESWNIPLVGGSTFRRVLDWCRNHSDLREPLAERDPYTGSRKFPPMTPWEIDFFSALSVADLTRLLNASHYLDARHLYTYCCREFAAHLRNKMPSEIRQMLNIQTRHTEEEERRILASNPWIGFLSGADAKIGRGGEEGNAMHKAQEEPEEQQQQEQQGQEQGQCSSSGS